MPWFTGIRTFRSSVFSLLGAKVPTELSLPGTKVLSGNFRSEEQKYRGAKSPDTPKTYRRLTLFSLQNFVME